MMGIQDYVPKNCGNPAASEKEDHVFLDDQKDFGSSFAFCCKWANNWSGSWEL